MRLIVCTSFLGIVALHPSCEALLHFARKRNLATGPRQNNPTGKSPKILSSPFAKKYSA
jgi:hypothetical protein